MSECKFKVGDAVLFERFGDLLKGKVVKVDNINKKLFPVVVFLDDSRGVMTFTLDGRCYTSDTKASLSVIPETPSCKFKVGDAVVFSHERCYDGQPVKGVVTDVDFQYKFPISTELEKGVGLQCFTADGRLHMREDPSLRLASETPTWTVILLYPDYMTDNFGADLYVDSAEADDPYEAVKIVQEMAAAANSSEFTEAPNDFRCIGVIKGEHDFVLDAMSF